MARTDYGAILSTVIKDTSDSIREVNETSALIAPNEWGGLIRAMHSDSEYQSALAGLQKNTIENVPIASFNALSGVKLDSLKVLVEAVQSGSGTPSPDNVRPITGWSGANVTRTGKNLFDKDSTPLESGKYISGGSIGGSPSYTTNANYNVYKIAIKPNTTYTFGVIKANAPCWATLDIDNKITRITQTGGGTEGTTITFTSQSGDYWLLLSVAVRDTYKCDDILQLEEGTATAYAPYNGNTYTIQFGDTYYGGELDVTNGVLRVTHAKQILNGSETWTNNAVRNGFYLAQILPTNKNFAQYPCNEFDTLSSDNTGDVTGIIFGLSNRYIFVTGVVGTVVPTQDTSAWRTWLASNPIEYVYPLETPFTIQLTPQQIEQLEENNIWADSGDVSECKYYASGSEPEFESTKICDNSSYDSTLTFTDDYTNYDFIKLVVYNSSSQIYTEIVTTPEMITNSFTYSNNLFNLNEVGNNQYCCYQKQSNTSWSRYGKRSCDVKEVYGLNCTNKTVSKTTIYNRQAIGSTSVTITSATSLFDYDYLILGSCTGNADETQPCNEVFNAKDIFGRRCDTRTIFANSYNANVGALRMTEFEISSWSYYFFVQGIKFK